jgi:hypothetical protein
MNHENLHRDHTVEGSSDRAFGLVFAAVFAIVAAWPLLGGGGPRWWALTVAAAFVLLALLAPRWLAVPNRWWTRLGVLLGRVVSPIALAVLFYGAFAPMGAVLRLIGKDPLRLKRDREAASYWIRRDPPGPAPGSLTRQF